MYFATTATMKRIVAVTFFALAVCTGGWAQAGTYAVDKNVLIHPSGDATLCALVVRPAGPQRRPAALEFTIYVDPDKDLERLEYAADRGYVGVMAYTRGKGCSPQSIVPYEWVQTVGATHPRWMRWVRRNAFTSRLLA